MAEPNENDLKAIAREYERRLVPALFQPWTRRILDFAQIQPGQRTLDVACGTGVLARAARNRCGRESFVAGVDTNAGALTVAAEINPEIDWSQGKAEALPYPDAAFDMVVSQFGLMFFEDKPRAMSEIKRVLAPNGRFALAVFDSLDRNPVYATLVEIYHRLAGEAVGKALRYPFSMGDAEELGSLAAVAGIPRAVVTSHTETARFSSIRELVLADVLGWFPLAQIRLDETVIDNVAAEAESLLAKDLSEDGSIAFETAALFVSADLP